VCIMQINLLVTDFVFAFGPHVFAFYDCVACIEGKLLSAVLKYGSTSLRDGHSYFIENQPIR